ncbi:hypothetical protein ACFPPA_01085 [Rhodanobacter ginsengisoli]|uniref:Uncharacterized protein n=1 Tax=Rhodanobacter ginsengisoli TaxID=418646 RepID=A0ABW0QHQ6_9GAMM
MSNTIELLEVIGKDASLRHASGEDLSQALSGLQASEGLKRAAISGDDGPLVKELGHRDIKGPNHVNQNHGPCHDDDGNDGGKDHDKDDGKDHGVPGMPE